ncbi:MAG: PQQ-binding-like beta-propeller repeat protein [Acidobacteriota bacterium]|nr:PQQ-binding-like beta-propeller repeat protein [Acidobacteriota bacterium]
MAQLARTRTILNTGLVVAALASAAVGQNWPRLRGADATGVVADDPRLPETWDRSTNVRWKAEIPGWGWSSPVVWGDRVFVSSAHGDEDYEGPKAGMYLGRGRQEPPDGVHHWMVYGLSLTTGELLWSSEAHSGAPSFPRHPKNTYASETPTTDGERLYVLFGDLGLYAYDFDGNQVWKVAIEARETKWGYGAAASPVVHEGQVMLVYDNEEDSYIAAYDASTGRERWRVARDEPSTWATPFIWENELRTEIVVPGRLRNRSYSLEGDLIWHFDGHMSSLTIPTPFAVDGLLYITSGYFSDNPRPAFAIRPGAKGDIGLAEGATSNEFIRWYQPMIGPYNPSPIVYRGLYYTLLDRGFLTLNDAKTGEEIYGRVRFSGSPTFTSSPWAYNGKVFFLSEDGETIVIDAKRDFEEVRSNDLDELSLSTPSIAQGKLLIRTASHVWCISNEG